MVTPGKIQRSFCVGTLILASLSVILTVTYTSNDRSNEHAYNDVGPVKEMPGRLLHQRNNFSQVRIRNDTDDVVGSKPSFEDSKISSRKGRNETSKNFIKRSLTLLPRKSHRYEFSNIHDVKSQVVYSTETLNADNLLLKLIQNSESPGESACSIPSLDPYHESIRHLVRDPLPLNCEARNDRADLTYFDENGDNLWINSTVLAGRRVQGCIYAYVMREDDKITVFGQKTTVVFDDETDFSSDVLLVNKITSDYIGVQCTIAGSKKPLSYEMHAHISPLPQVFKRAKMFSEESQTSGLDVSVIMLGFESTSRMNFIRQMPKAYRYLTETMEAVVLKGYNIVGDATAEALIPMHTGKRWTELPETRQGEPGAKSVQIYPLVWKRFQEQGFATLFAEDSPHLAAFNRQFNGFVDQPTDHYMRTYWLKSCDLTEGYHFLDSPKICEGARPEHLVMFNYLKEFQVKYNHVKKFGFMFLSEISHNDINLLAWADDDLLSYLKVLFEGDYLKNTIHFVFGDHGARYNALRNTAQGKLEERLPFMAVYFPPSLRQSQPLMYQNLRENIERLSTPFDVHATLEHLLGIPTEAGNQSQRAVSLLRKIPISRTCGDAGVAPHWCTCLNWAKVSVMNAEVVKASRALLKHINNLTEPYREYCAELSLSDVKSALIGAPNDKVLRYAGSVDDDQLVPGFRSVSRIDLLDVKVSYQVVIETVPGQALFEGTMTTQQSRDFSVEKDISRINLYGNQPQCIAAEHPYITKYCYCKDNLR
ncbi:uncharacterized protein [Ptychodera flava]|uniref:uncharacterized protein n=1 Tax=Ptychodera flava TaxID=63121 RepID=UPI00396AA8EC